MKKIKDRMLLGVIGGVAGNLVKLSLGYYFKKKKLAEIDGPERAAGMLVPPHTIFTKEGKIVGYLADGAVGSLLGVSMVYLLSITGKNQGVLKGAATGQAMWTFLYGVLGTLGATKVNAATPKTVLSEYISHTAYGLVTACVVLGLGEKGLFDGTIPLYAGCTKVQVSKDEKNDVYFDPKQKPSSNQEFWKSKEQDYYTTDNSSQL